jgi:hypothetical protein
MTFYRFHHDLADHFGGGLCNDEVSLEVVIKKSFPSTDFSFLMGLDIKISIPGAVATRTPRNSSSKGTNSL